MKGRTLLVVALAGAARSLAAQAPSPEEQQRIAAAMLAAAAPGPEHAQLARLAGTWKMTTVFYPWPGQPPMTVTGTAENRMILGGRFLESRTEGGEAPTRIESLTLLGFDRRHKQYTTVGYDTWGTYYVTAAGRLNESSGTIVMHGTDDDPIAGHKQEYTINLRIVDDNTYVTDVTFTDQAHTRGKGPFKALDITFTRK